MLNILCLSNKGEGYDVAFKLSKGNIVKFYTENPEANNLGSGFQKPKILGNISQHLEAADLVLSFNGRGGSYLRGDEKIGGVVLGEGVFTKLISDPGSKATLLKTLAIDTDIDPDGIPLIVEGWFNGKQFISPFILAIPDYKFMHGNLGYTTEGMGWIVSFIQSGEIFDRTLKQLEPFLKKAGHKGPISIDLSLSNDKLNYRGIHSNFRRGLLQAVLENTKISNSEFLYKVASGFPTKLGIRNNFVSIVSLSLPPYPYTYSGYTGSSDVIKIEHGARPHVWLENIYKSNKKVYYGAINGFIGYVSAWGETIREAKRRVYRTIRNTIKSDDIQFRYDIGRHAEDILEMLSDRRYINATEERKVLRSTSKERPGIVAQV